jgi:hypothetical protein
VGDVVGADHEGAFEIELGLPPQPLARSKVRLPVMIAPHHYWRFRDRKVEYYRGSKDTAQTPAMLSCLRLRRDRCFQPRPCHGAEG